jgi:uncharacterized phage-associated protein
MKAPYSALDIAKWIVAGIDRDAGESITPLKLQKLLYYVQAWALVFRQKPIFDEDFQAWAHGPVVDSVYQEYREHGWNGIPPGNCPEIDSEIAAHIDSVMDAYGDFSAKQLESMTHQEDPWRIARGGLPVAARSSAVISKKSMKDFYSDLYEKSSDGQQ